MKALTKASQNDSRVSMKLRKELQDASYFYCAKCNTLKIEINRDAESLTLLPFQNKVFSDASINTRNEAKILEKWVTAPGSISSSLQCRCHVGLAVWLKDFHTDMMEST